MPLEYVEFFDATFALTPEDVVVVLTNPETDSPERYAMAVRWWEGLTELSRRVGATVLPLVTFPDTGVNGAPFPDFLTMGEEDLPIDAILAKNRVTLVVALTAHSATGPLMDITRRYEGIRAASLPGVLPEMEETALQADPRVLVSRNNILRTLLDEAVRAEITFSTGDQLTLDLRPNPAGTNVAQSDDGILPPNRPQRLINLPSGETFRCPYEEDDPGAADVDSERQSKTEGVLPIRENEEEIRLIVRRGRIVTVEGDGERADAYRQLFAVDPVRGNIAEFGLGSNPKAVVRGAILEDEKVGPHIAYGRSDYLGGLIGVKHFAQPENVLHVDIVYAAQSGVNIQRMILVSASGEEQVIMVDGEYTIF